ncbi:hypothetical protein H5T88_00715 [bacterium]|nr:hypothetical protein [bacterium]
MKKVKVKTTLTIGLRNYLAGEIAELDDDLAKELIALDLVELVEEKEEKTKRKGK